MPETTSLRPEEIEVQTYQNALKQFFNRDEDPVTVDPAVGYWTTQVGRTADGRFQVIWT